MKKKKKINKTNYYLKVIKKIENTRKKNNINWMDLLRIAFKTSPTEAKKIMARISRDDGKISKLIRKLSS